MMKRNSLALILAVLVGVALCGHTRIAQGEVTKILDDVTLSGGFQSGHYPELWDLTACDLALTFTYDGNGLVDDYGSSAHAWSELGVRALGYGNFNPTFGVEGAGVWLATDYEWSVDTFDPDPANAPTLDLDDKLILQKAGGNGEGDYNLPSPPPNPWANHAVWFDRDGVDQYQALMWGAIDGVTYNTGGIYDVVITLHADTDAAGTAYMTINGEAQGFYDPAWHAGPADLMPAGMTFTGEMSQMQVFYGLYGYGATHSVVLEDIVATGCLRALVIDGCDTGLLDQVLDGDGLISEHIDDCAAGARNHGKFVSCVAELTNDLKEAGIITGQEKGAIQSCAARADIP